MSEVSAPNHDQLSPSQVHQVEDACNRFEAAWQAGPRPRIEDHLGDTQEPGRSLLLRELLLLEFHYRHHHGEAPGAAEYHPRFPGLDADWLNRALAATFS